MQPYGNADSYNYSSFIWSNTKSILQIAPMLNSSGNQLRSCLYKSSNKKGLINDKFTTYTPHTRIDIMLVHDNDPIHDADNITLPL